LLDRCRDPTAGAFYRELVEKGCDPNAHIDVLPHHRVLYLCVPKCASTTIKMVLSATLGRSPSSFEHVHKRVHTGLKSPYEVGPSALHWLVHDRAALRFSFVRNPYDRLVSAWADKFQNKPLLGGDSFIDKYLKHREAIDPSLPAGADRTLPFADFVRFASGTADRRLDPHWQSQDDLLSMPGIRLDFIGKVESFEQDFGRVLDHIGAPRVRCQTDPAHLNKSAHRPWRDYYTPALAAEAYRAYERDFDRLGYARAM
jgi:hypothetical protein